MVGFRFPWILLPEDAAKLSDVELFGALCHEICHFQRRDIMEKPEFLLPDEPLNSLDQSGVEEMRALFQEKAASGVTILPASHHGEDIDHLCDTVHRIERGVMTPLIPAG